VSPGTDYRGFLAAFYNRSASLLRTIEARLERELRSAPCYPARSVAKRLLQEVAFILVAPLRKEDARRTLRGLEALESASGPFRCAGLWVDPVSGQVRPAFRLWLASLGNFFIHWLAVAATMVSAAFGRSRRGPATLVFGVPEENLFAPDDAQFAAFARSMVMTPLGKADRLLVQTIRGAAPSTEPQRLGYARHPILRMVRDNPPGAGAVLRFGWAHLRCAAGFLLKSFRQPLFALLWKDYAYFGLAQHLNARGVLQGIVLTAGNWGQQFLWMTDLPQRRFRTHLAFYSMNDRPFAYADVEERCDAHPTLRLIRADEFWVWTPGHAALLEKEGMGAKKNVAGPIVWAPLPRSAAREKKWISVFDITPLTTQANEEFGFLGNYFSADNLHAFLDGIENAVAVSGVAIPVVVKPKRAAQAIHDPRYLARVASTGFFRPLPAQTPVAEVVAQSALVIVYPFSSVAYVADALGVLAVYFDPTGQLVPTFEPRATIAFASGTESLARMIERATQPAEMRL